MALNEPYDVAVIDIMLPKRDGLSLIEEMRRKGVNTPVLILSAKRSVDDRIKGLRTGSDDYLTKPFSFAELLARVQALLRRANPSSEPTRLVLGDLSLNLITREVKRGERPIDLQPREFSLLEYLMRNAGSVVSKTMIMEHVWHYDFDPATNVVEACIYRLREEIDRGMDTKLDTRTDQSLMKEFNELSSLKKLTGIEAVVTQMNLDAESEGVNIGNIRGCGLG